MTDTGFESRPLYTGHRLASKQVSARLLPELGGNSGFDVVYGLSMRPQRFGCPRLSHPHLTCNARLFTRPFTTTAFDRSCVWRFEACSYKPTSKGLPSSRVQHDACASS